MRRALLCWLALCLNAFAWGASPADPSPPSAEAQRLDAQAFNGLAQHITDTLSDVQSAVVVLNGRQAFSFYRDGDAEALRATHSVAKSALALLVGTALQRGQLTSLDQPVLALMPEWQALNPDRRTSTLTLRHLLAMTAGFDVNDRTGTAPALSPAQAWARPLGAAPGERFAYDNSIPPLIVAVLEKVTGQPVAGLAQDQLFNPLAMRAPQLANGRLQLRTEDMAKLGQLLLSDGAWNGQALLMADVASQIRQPASAGGAPVGLPYGLSWWTASADTYFASGWGGQLVWVYRPMGLVVAVTSVASRGSAERGQALRLVRGPLFEAAQRRQRMTGP